MVLSADDLESEQWRTEEERSPQDNGADIPELKALGVGEVFTPGAPTDVIVEFIQRHAADKQASAAV